ncbi:MAG: hypothetical protein M3082_17545 [Candidatus Dormibacteraeota bacterium]|nr:hypothetical protein [Candidatus Dormibacteraeota bacterium]
MAARRGRRHAPTPSLKRSRSSVVVPRLTSFALSVDAADAGIQETYVDAGPSYSRLVDDQARTDMIVTDVLEAVGAGRAPLVLTGRTEHLERNAGTPWLARMEALLQENER